MKTTKQELKLGASVLITAIKQWGIITSITHHLHQDVPVYTVSFWHEMEYMSVQCYPEELQ